MTFLMCFATLAFTGSKRVGTMNGDDIKML